MRMVCRLLFALHAFVGIGAVAGSSDAITNPQEPLGVSVELLKDSPSSNYLIPGIILFTIIGLGINNLKPESSSENTIIIKMGLASTNAWASS